MCPNLMLIVLDIVLDKANGGFSSTLSFSMKETETTEVCTFAS